MNIIKTLSNLTWGSDQNSLILIYKSLILSLINYGSVIYGTGKEKILKSLGPVHNQRIRLASGAFRTSPVDSILCNAGEPSLQIIRNINTAKYIIKTSNLSNHVTASNFHPNQINSHTTVYENHIKIKESISLNNTPINKISSPSFAPWNWSPEVNTQLIKYNKKND